MTYSLDQLVAELVRDEGFRAKPYTDTTGHISIGIGRNLTDKGITETEAHFLLHTDILDVATDLDRVTPWWRTLSDARQRALVNMGFNLGITGLLRFRRMLKALREGNYPMAAAEAVNSSWAGQVGDRAYRISKMIEEG